MRLILIIAFITSLLLNSAGVAQDKLDQRIVSKAEVVLRGLEDEEIEKQFIFQLQNRIDLTSNQIDTIRKIYIGFKKELVKKKAERDIHKIELEETLTSAEPDFEYMKMKLKELARLNEAIMLSRINIMQQIFELLTPRQRQKLKTITGTTKSKE